MNNVRGAMYGSVVVFGVLTVGLVIADRRGADPSGNVRANGVKSVVPKIEQPKTQTEPEHKSDVEQVVATALSNIELQGPDSKLISLRSVIDELESPEHAKEAIPQKAGEAIAQAWFGLVEQSTVSYEDNKETSLKTVKFLASRTRGKATRAGILKILEQGPADIRAAALEGIDSPHGVHSPEIFAKIQEMGEHGGIESGSLPSLLMRTGGKKAIGPIIALLNKTDDGKTISACAVVLQDYRDPQLLGFVFDRLDQLGMLEDQNKLPWISGKLLAKHLEKADDGELLRAVKAMSARPSLVKSGLAFAAKGLDASDPQMRRLSAIAVKKAVLAKQIDAASGEKLLVGRLNQETEPVLKLELAGGLEQIRGLNGTIEGVEMTN